ncbi:MAG: hypothetical protein HYY30_05235 [Chloroflexi bacterium]|nr:hypothetical protein [Chloroflexota bacterium]
MTLLKQQEIYQKAVYSKEWHHPCTLLADDSLYQDGAGLYVLVFVIPVLLWKDVNPGGTALTFEWRYLQCQP